MFLHPVGVPTQFLKKGKGSNSQYKLKEEVKGAHFMEEEDGGKTKKKTKKRQDEARQD